MGMSGEIKMRKIVAGLFQTLDGVVESPEKWQFACFNDEMGRETGAQAAAADTMLLGGGPTRSSPRSGLTGALMSRSRR